MAPQSQEEILRLFDEYGRGFAPSDLIFDEHNAVALFNYVVGKYGLFTMFSISYLIEAEKTLGPKLNRKKEPTKAELAAKGEARMHRDWLRSLEPQTTLYQQKLGQDRLDAGKRERAEKEYQTVLNQIEFEISNHLVGHPSGATNYARTESERDLLRQTRDKQDRRTIEGAKRALSAVRTKKATL